MGQMIHKPDANPIVFALANWFVCGALGYYMMGQQKKAMIAGGIWVVSFILLPCTFGLSTFGMFIAIITAIDAYQLGQRLQKGEQIGENENALEFLNAIFKD